MKNLNIKSSDIFKNGSILTLDKANALIGKKLAITNGEYRGNSESVRVFTLLSIQSEWDIAANEDISHLDGGKYATRQDHWATLSNPERFKVRLKLVTDGAPAYATCDTSDKWTYDEPTFFGSDSDRPIFFIEIN